MCEQTPDLRILPRRDIPHPGFCVLKFLDPPLVCSTMHTSWPNEYGISFRAHQKAFVNMFSSFIQGFYGGYQITCTKPFRDTIIRTSP